MPSPRVIEMTDTAFTDQVLQSSLPVLIDFTSAWCPPCRAMAPHVAAIAEAYAGRLQVATCDVDSNRELAGRLDVRSVPTLMLFKAGRPIGQLVGAVPRAKLDALVSRAFDGG